MAGWLAGWLASRQNAEFLKVIIDQIFKLFVASNKVTTLEQCECVKVDICGC